MTLWQAGAKRAHTLVGLAGEEGAGCVEIGAWLFIDVGVRDAHFKQLCSVGSNLRELQTEALQKKH